MASKSLKLLEEQITCAICLDIYKEPKILQCFHAYCKQCLERLVVRNRDGGFSLTCPTCRVEAVLPENGVAGLQAAFRINHLLDLQASLRSVEEPSSSTSFDSESRDAGDMAYGSSNFGSSDLDSRIPPISGLGRSQSIDSCSKHVGKELELFCKDCDELICLQCTIRQHHGHNYDMVTTVFTKHREDIEDSLKPLEKQLDVIDEALMAFNMRAEEIKDLSDSLEGGINDTIGKLQEVLDARRGELVEQLHQTTQAKLNDIEAQKERLEASRSQLNSCLKLAKDTVKISNQAELLKKKATIMQQVKELTTSFPPEHPGPKTEADMIFSISPDLLPICQMAGTVFTPTSLDLNKCQVVGEGLFNAMIGETATITLHARNSREEPCEEEVTSLKCELISELTGESQTALIERKGLSKYELSYQPVFRGKHRLHLKSNNQPLLGSPFSVMVKVPGGKFKSPYFTIEGFPCVWDVAISRTNINRIVVSECNQQRVSILNRCGEVMKRFGMSERNFQYPRGIAVDHEGNIFVVDSGNRRVQKFTSEGVFLKASDPGRQLFNDPKGMTFNPKNKKIYVADDKVVQVLNATDLTFSHSLSMCSGPNKQQSMAFNIGCDKEGNIYITDKVNSYILVYTTEGKLLNAFHFPGTQKGGRLPVKKMGPTSPSAIFVEDDGKMYVCSNAYHQIFVLTPEGNVLNSFGGEGSATGEFKQPRGLVVDERGILYVCDSLNNRVQVFKHSL